MSDSEPSDALQPTIIHASEEQTAERSLDVSRAKVGLVEGTRPRFADETATLLRDRLKAASLVLSIILALAFVGNLFVQYAPLVGVRLVILLALFSTFVLLRSERRLALAQLRWIELGVFDPDEGPPPPPFDPPPQDQPTDTR